MVLYRTSLTGSYGFRMGKTKATNLFRLIAFGFVIHFVHIGCQQCGAFANERSMPRFARREQIDPFREPGASSECMNAFPTRGGGRSGYDEAPVSGAQCVQSVGAGLPDRPAVGAYRYNQTQANPSPGTRAVEDACPYKRRWVFRFTPSRQAVPPPFTQGRLPPNPSGRLITAPTGAEDAGG